jgi:hypothetical protein
VGYRTDGNDRAGYLRSAVVYNDGGGANLQGPVNTPMTRESDGGWDVTIDVSGSDARIRVEGDASQTINWQSKHTTNEVS